MMDILTIGSATKDVFLISKNFTVIKSDKFSTGYGECFSFGSKIELKDLYEDTGGGGTNTAVSFSRFGLKTAVYTRIGADTSGKEILETLKKHKITTSFVITDKNKKTGYSTILLTPQGDRTILVYRGASTDFSDRELPVTTIKTKWIYLSSVAGNMDLLKKVFRYADKTKTKIAWNPGSHELKQGIKSLGKYIAQTDILLVNSEEAAALTGLQISAHHKMLRKLTDFCKHYVVITDGAKGAYASDGADHYFAKPVKVKVINTTGAGDAFGAGFTAGIIRTGSVKEALRVGTLNATGVIQEMGAKNGLLSSFPSKSSLSKIKVKQIN